MPLKFAANLNWLFKEQSQFISRYAAAARAGFTAVESADPYEIPIDTLHDAKTAAGLQHVLMNIWPGDRSKGEIGLAAVPGRQEAFRKSLETSIDYCKRLECKRLHIMAGRKTSEHSEAQMHQVYVENLRFAAESLQEHGITALIEPINSTLSVPGYFTDSVYKAVQVIEEVDHPNLKLQMDLFHVQIMHGNLTSIIEKHFPLIGTYSKKPSFLRTMSPNRLDIFHTSKKFEGHFQIAQVPDRHEPSSVGEIDYTYIFSLLERLGYDGYIGLEYIPSGDTIKGLQWYQEYMQLSS